MLEKIDSQVVEILGRNYLVNELYKAGIEVARPERDKGIDLIGYIDTNYTFRAVPIQMKASSERSFGIDRKYEKFANMLLVHIWNLRTDNDTEVYATTYVEAVSIAQSMGWTESPSWVEKNWYSTRHISPKLQELMNPYRMNTANWKMKILG